MKKNMINYYQNIGLKYHSILYRENLFSAFVLSFRYHCTYRTNSCGNAIANSQGFSCSPLLCYRFVTTTLTAQIPNGNAIANLLGSLHAETGFSYFGARYYDSDLMTGWLSVDPMADKYPSLSPYAYCGWNPVRLVDPDGEELDIPDITQNNRKQTQDDILSLVKKENRNRILFDKNGSIKLDLDGLNKSQIENDKGLCLLSDLINSPKKYYYETNDQISCEIMYDG